MKKKILLSILLVSLAMNVGVAAVLGLRSMHNKNAATSPGCPFVTKDAHLFTTLGLSPGQLARITPLAHEFHEELGKLSGEIHEKRNLMIATMEQEPVANDQLNRQRQEIAVLQASLQQRVMAHILQMKTLLSPEQQKIFFQALRQSFLTQNFN